MSKSHPRRRVLTEGAAHIAIFRQRPQHVSHNGRSLAPKECPLPNAIPAPHELDSHPELAALFIIEQVLAAADCALRSANPNLDDPGRPYWLRRPLSEQLATRIVSLGATLSSFVRNYGAALLVEQARASATETVGCPVRAEEL